MSVHAGDVAERWFLKIDGIEGESTDAAHKGEIDVESWSWGVTNTGSSSGGGGGGGAGKASFQDFHFVTKISKASPKLFLAAATGSHHKQVGLSGVRGAGKGKGVDFLKVKLTDVLVSGFQQSDGPADVPADQFSLNFAKIEVSYFPQGPSGKLESPITAGFDVSANKKL
jgi:type VI secretion system secreted protein Hcp